MGTFDGDPRMRPSVRKFVTYAAPWEPIPDDGLASLAPGEEVSRLSARQTRFVVVEVLG